MPNLTDILPYEIPYLRTLHDRLVASRASLEGRVFRVERYGFVGFLSRPTQLARLPYGVAAAYRSVVDLLREQEDIVEETLHTTAGINRNTHILDSDNSSTHRMCRRLDGVLDSIVRAQEGFGAYLEYALGMRTPGSFRALMEKPEIIQHEAVREELLKYWSSTGKQARCLRDLSHHHMMPASDVVIAFDNAGQAFVYFALPKNFDERSILKQEYGDPAVPFAIRAYQDLYRTCFRAAALLLEQVGGRTIDAYRREFIPRGGGDLYRPGVMWIEPIRFSESCRRLRQELEAEYPVAKVS